MQSGLGGRKGCICVSIWDHVKLRARLGGLSVIEAHVIALGGSVE